MDQKKAKDFYGLLTHRKKPSFQHEYFSKWIGRMYESNGHHMIAFKLYLIFLKTNLEDQLVPTRIHFLCFWDDIFRLQGKKISNRLGKPLLLHSEMIVFSVKLQQQNGNQAFSVFLWKKLGRICFLRFKKVKCFKKWKILNIFYFNLWIRTSKTKRDYNQKKNSHFFWIQKEDFKETEKLFFLTLHNFFQMNNNNFFPKKKFQVLFRSISFSQKEKQPLLFTIWKDLTLLNMKKLSEKNIKIFFYITKIHVKWFIALSVQWAKEKKEKNNAFFMKIFLKKKWETLYESYNPIGRNFSFQTGFLSKLANLQLVNGFLVESLNSYKAMVKKKYSSIELLNKIALIKEKMFTKSKALRTFIQGIKIYFEKTLSVPKKYFRSQGPVWKIWKQMENFFEIGNIDRLSHLVISILLLQTRKLFRFLQFHEKYRKKVQKKKYTRLPGKDYLKKFFFLKNSLEVMKKKKFQTIFAPLLNCLVERIVFLFEKNQVFRKKDKSLHFLVSNPLFYHQHSRFVRYVSMSVMIQKKKFKKTYTILRLQCIKDPYSFHQWCLLSKFENQFGFLIAKTLRYSLRLLIKYPSSVPAMIFSGNHCSFFGSFGYSLAEYFQAYRWKKDSPFLNFLISIQYLNGSLSRKVLNSEFSIFLSLCFFSEYKRLRLFVSQRILHRSLSSKFLEIELMYNTARLYLFLGLNYQALKTFQKGLRWPQTALSVNKTRRRFIFFRQKNLKKEMLFNISILFRAFGNKALSELNE